MPLGLIALYPRDGHVLFRGTAPPFPSDWYDITEERQPVDRGTGTPFPKDGYPFSGGRVPFSDGRAPLSEGRYTQFPRAACPFSEGRGTPCPRDGRPSREGRSALFLGTGAPYPMDGYPFFEGRGVPLSRGTVTVVRATTAFFEGRVPRCRGPCTLSPRAGCPFPSNGYRFVRGTGSPFPKDGYIYPLSDGRVPI